MKSVHFKNINVKEDFIIITILYNKIMVDRRSKR